MAIREFGNIWVEFFYDERKDNPYVVRYTWAELDAEPVICNYSFAAFDKIIREELSRSSRSIINANFRFDDWGLLLRYFASFSDMKNVAKFDADYGLNGTLIEFVKKNLREHIDYLKKQTDELEKGLEEC